MRDLEHRTSNERTQSKERQLAKHVYSQILKSAYLSVSDFSFWVYSGASKTSLFLYPMENHKPPTKMILSLECPALAPIQLSKPTYWQHQNSFLFTSIFL